MAAAALFLLNSESASGRGVVVYFANGMISTPDDWTESKITLEERIAVRPELVGADIRVDLARNWSKGWIRDLLEAADQLDLEAPTVLDFLRGQAISAALGFSGLIGATRLFIQAVIEVASETPEIAYLQEQDLDEQLDQYRSESAGSGIVIVAHSQGNLFTRDAQEVLGAEGIRTVAVPVAPPDLPPYMIDSERKRYTLLHEDVVINLAARSAALTFGLNLPPFANEHNSFIWPFALLDLPGCLLVAVASEGVEVDDCLFHGFVNTYLEPRSNSETRILNDVSDAILLASEDGPAASFGGVWIGRVLVTVGSDTGTETECAGAFEQANSFEGSVRCQGDVSPRAATGMVTAGGVIGLLLEDGTEWQGVVGGENASGTWHTPATGNSGTWSATRIAATAFEFALLRLAVDGNLGGAGAADSIPDLVDSFDDGSVVAPPTSSLVCYPGPCMEAGGALLLSAIDGFSLAVGGPFRVLEDSVLSIPVFRDGAGSAQIDAVFRAVVPNPGEFYGISLGSTQLAVQDDGAGTSINGVPVDLSTTDKVFLRLRFDDLGNEVVGEFRLRITEPFTLIGATDFSPGAGSALGVQGAIGILFP